MICKKKLSSCQNQLSISLGTMCTQCGLGGLAIKKSLFSSSLSRCERNKIENYSLVVFWKLIGPSSSCVRIEKYPLLKKILKFCPKISDDLKTYNSPSAWGWPLDFASPFYAYLFPKLVGWINHHHCQNNHCNAFMGYHQQLISCQILSFSAMATRS